MIRLCSSAMICCQPTSILSATAMSSADSKSTASMVTVVLPCPLKRTEDAEATGSHRGTEQRSENGKQNCSSLFVLCSSVSLCDSVASASSAPLVCHTVNDVVHAELIRLVRFVDRFQAGVGPLPELRDVGVVIDHHQDPPGRVVVLVNGPEDRWRRIVVLRHVERLDFEERVKDRVRQIHVEDPRLRQDARDLRLEIPPVLKAEVVDDDEAALLQVGPQAGRFLIRQR